MPCSGWPTSSEGAGRWVRWIRGLPQTGPGQVARAGDQGSGQAGPCGRGQGHWKAWRRCGSIQVGASWGGKKARKPSSAEHFFWCSCGHLGQVLCSPGVAATLWVRFSWVLWKGVQGPWRGWWEEDGQAGCLPGKGTNATRTRSFVPGKWPSRLIMTQRQPGIAGVLRVESGKRGPSSPVCLWTPRLVICLPLQGALGARHTASCLCGLSAPPPSRLHSGHLPCG